MPATAGRVKMPHNNRMSTSATLKSTSIWANTIGYDPHKNLEEEGATAASAAAKSAAVTEETVKSVMQMARSQNVTDGAKRDDFTAKLYMGLKKGKVRRTGTGDDRHNAPAVMDPKLQELLDDPDSSSEDEFVQVSQERKKVKTENEDKKTRTNKRSKRKRSSANDASDSSSDDDSSYERRKRRREKRKRGVKKRKHLKRSRDHSSDDSRSDSDEEDRRRRKSRKSRKKSKETSGARRTRDSD
jgi:hypothetical protein